MTAPLRDDARCMTADQFGRLHGCRVTAELDSELKVCETGGFIYKWSHGGGRFHGWYKASEWPLNRGMHRGRPMRDEAT